MLGREEEGQLCLRLGGVPSWATHSHPPFLPKALAVRSATTEGKTRQVEASGKGAALELRLARWQCSGQVCECQPVTWVLLFGMCFMPSAPLWHINNLCIHLSAVHFELYIYGTVHFS